MIFLDNFFRLALKLLCILIVVTAGTNATHAGTCQLREEISLDAQFPNGNRIIVPVTIENQPLNLILDTGAAATSTLFETSVANLHLTPRDMRDRAYDLAGQPMTRFVEVNSLIIGNKIFKRAQFIVWPQSNASNDAAGLLGPDVLTRFDLEIDPANRKVNLFSQDHCPGNVVYWTRDATDSPLKMMKSGHVVMSMMLDGKSIDALIDTGATHTIISLPAARRLFGLSPDSLGVAAVEMPPGAPPAQLKQYRYKFASLSVGGIKIAHPEIVMMEDKVARRPDLWDAQMSLYGPQSDEKLQLPDLILGMNILGKLRFYIAYGEQHFYASAATAH